MAPALVLALSLWCQFYREEIQWYSWALAEHEYDSVQQEVQGLSLHQWWEVLCNGSLSAGQIHALVSGVRVLDNQGQ